MDEPTRSGANRMIHKPLHDVRKEDIDSLVHDKTAERRTLEYKRELPEMSDKGKKELLADVSSLANSSGGDLVYGVAAKNGVPTEACGLRISDPDAAILRLESSIRDGIAPRIQGIASSCVDGFQNGPVILVRVPKSWSLPHMVTFKNSSRFFTRDSRGKHQMDVGEVRSAFALSESLPVRIRQFRDERLARILAGDTPVPLVKGAYIVLHVLPFSCFSIDSQFAASTLLTQGEHLYPLGLRSGNRRYNVDGVVSYSPVNDPPRKRYCQAFRSGAIESVDTGLLSIRGTRLISAAGFEPNVVTTVHAYLKALSSLNVPPPAVVLLSMLNVAGYEMAEPNRELRFEPTPIDRDTLLLPDVLVEDYSCNVPRVLRPIFDAVWNACGYERSVNYDEDGNWNPRR